MDYIERHFGLKKVGGADHVRYTLPAETGEGSFELFHATEGFQVWITNAQTRQDIDMSYAQDENAYIGMAYIETDHARDNTHKERASSIQSWRMTRSLPSDGVSYGVCRADTALHAVNILFFQAFFQYCSGDHNANRYFDVLKTIQSFDEQAFMHELYPILAEILHCSYQETARKLFVKSKVYDIAAHLIALCDSEAAQPIVKLGKFDIEQIRTIPALLKMRMGDPPSIAGLARMVALNEYKLKAGFKKIYNTTIYEYLRQIRAEKAIDLMKEDIPLEQIAERIGYKSTRGFSQAFAKCIGVTPAQWRNQSNRSSTLQSDTVTP
jgi:AraC-like DNA-binding protein